MKRGSSLCFRGSGRRFCVGQGSDVPSMFCTSVIQVDIRNNFYAIEGPEKKGEDEFVIWELIKIQQITF